jgi:hypothetical protein
MNALIFNNELKNNDNKFYSLFIDHICNLAYEIKSESGEDVHLYLPSDFIQDAKYELIYKTETETKQCWNIEYDEYLSFCIVVKEINKKESDGKYLGRTEYKILSYAIWNDNEYELENMIIPEKYCKLCITIRKIIIQIYDELHSQFEYMNM